MTSSSRQEKESWEESHFSPVFLAPLRLLGRKLVIMLGLLCLGRVLNEPPPGLVRSLGIFD
jgi:hypothetical protein